MTEKEKYIEAWGKMSLLLQLHKDGTLHKEMLEELKRIDELYEDKQSLTYDQEKTAFAHGFNTCAEVKTGVYNRAFATVMQSGFAPDVAAFLTSRWIAAVQNEEKAYEVGQNAIEGM